MSVMKVAIAIVAYILSVFPLLAKPDFKSLGRDDFYSWSTSYRETVKERIGYSELERRFLPGKVSATLKESTEYAGYSHKELLLNILPDDSLLVDMFIPKVINKTVPLVVVLEDREDISSQAVNEGYIVVSIPVRSLCETVWTVSRVIDYATENLSFDRTNVICVGSQQAGVSTIYCGAIDTRISICVTVASFCPSKQSETAEDLIALAGLIAPRLFHVVHGEKDESYPIKDVQSAMRDLRQIYAVAGNEDGCRVFNGEDNSRFYGNGVWRFVRWRLLPPKNSDQSTSLSQDEMPVRVRQGRKQLPVVECNGFSYAIVNSEAPTKIVLEGLSDEESLDVSPHAYRAKLKARKGKALIDIPRAGYYVIRGSSIGKLFLFVEDKLNTPAGVNVLDCSGIVTDGKTNITSALQSAINDNTGRILVFPKGVYLTSGLHLPSDSHIFLEDGAVIRADRDSVEYDIRGTRAFVEISDADNVSISGVGVIDGDGPAVKRGARNRRNLLIVNSSNVSVDGVISLNPASWNTHILGSQNVTLRNYKVLNDMLVWNTDGIDPDCSNNVLIENCFAHCGDDCIAIKTTDRLGEARDLSRVTVRGCVFMSNKAGLKIGTETCGASMHDILFEDNDVIEALKPIYLRVEDGAHLHDVVYRNNRFESCYSGPSAYDLYASAGFKQDPRPYHIVVRKRKKTSKVGSIYNVLIEECVYEQPFPTEPVIQNPCKARVEVEFKK